MKRSPHVLVNLFAVFLIVLLSLLLGSCGVWRSTQAWMGKKVEVGVRLHEAANDNSPVAVDLLFVHDQKILSELMTISAADWFRQKHQRQKDAQGDPGYTLWEWEWVPGQQVPVQQIPLQPRARAGLIFAGYQTPGEHRAQVPPHEPITVYLEKDDFTVNATQSR
jgi:type VI secretion system protein